MLAPDGRSIDLTRSVEAMEPYRHAEQSQDTYLLSRRLVLTADAVVS